MNGTALSSTHHARRSMLPLFYLLYALPVLLSSRFLHSSKTYVFPLFFQGWPSRAPLGSMGLLRGYWGAPCDSLGPPLGLSRGLLGLSWGPLGLSWGSLGAPLGSLGAPLGSLGTPLALGLPSQSLLRDRHRHECHPQPHQGRVHMGAGHLFGCRGYTRRGILVRPPTDGPAA